jgi:hypothetical protein
MAFPTDVRTAAVPDRVDMREYLWPVEHIGSTLAAAAASAVAALEYHCNRIGEKPINLSTLFVHYNARRQSGNQEKNVGTSLEAAMKAIAEHGACSEATWPFDAAKLTTAPPSQAYDEARKFAGVRCLHPVDFIEALALSFPVPFVARIPTRCLVDAGQNRVLPPLTAEERQRASDHPVYAMVIVGYDKADKTYLVRNCWGTAWGDGGHCRVSFDLLNSLVPPGSAQAWFIAKAQVAEAAGAGAPQVASAAPPAATTVAAAAPAPQESVASMAARMKSELRDSLQRDIADAARQIRDRVAPPAPAGSDVGTRACTMCNGTGRCWGCGGTGCASCGRTGRCRSCG